VGLKTRSWHAIASALFNREDVNAACTVLHECAI
jgi:hypothetical protein